MPTGTYTPLTQEQYQKAISAGFSPQKIIQNEQKRKASYTSAPAIDTTQKPVNYSPNASLGELYGETQPQKGYFASIMDTYASLPDKISQDVQESAKTMEQAPDKADSSSLIPGANLPGTKFGKFIEGAAKAGLRVAGDSAEAIFAPLSEAVGQVLDKSGAQALIQKGANMIVSATGISDNKGVQDWVMAHPNAADDFTRALTLVMSTGEKSDISKNLKDDASSIKKGVDQIKQGDTPTAVKKIIKYTSDIKDHIKGATSNDMSKRQLQTARANNGMILDSKIKALNDVKARGDFLKTVQDKQQSIADEKQFLIDQKEIELKQHQQDLETKTKQLINSKTSSKANLEQLKAENDAKIKATTDAYNAKLKENASNYKQAVTETHQAENELKSKQDTLAQTEELHKNQVNDASAKVNTALKESGFQNLTSGISSFLKGIRKSADEVYDNVPKDKVELAKIFSGIKDYIQGRYSAGDITGANKMEQNLNELKIRQIVGENKGDEKAIFNALAKSDIPIKMWQDLKPGEVDTKYPPLTADNLKATRNTLEDDIRKNNTPALKSFTDTVKSGFKSAFGDAIKQGEQSGTNQPGTLDKLNTNDATYSDLMRNPLWDKVQKGEDISPNDIKNNWEKFKTTAENVPNQVDEQGNSIQGTSGVDMIKKVQSTIGSQILFKADTLGNGKYNVDTIMKGIKNDGEMLGDDVKSTLQGIVDLHNQLAESDKATQDALDTEKESIKSESYKAKQIYSEKQSTLAEEKAKQIESIKTNKTVTEADLKKQQTDAQAKLKSEGKVLGEKSDLTSKELSDLKKQKSDIESTKDSIAKNPTDFLNNLNKVHSIEDYNSYLETTGKTAEEVKPVIFSSLLGKGFDILGKNDNFNFDNLGEVRDNLQKLGGGDPEVQKAMLGEDGVVKAKELSDAYDEYKRLKDTKGRTIAGKTVMVAFHAFLASGGLGFGRFFGIRGLLNDFGIGKKGELTSGSDRYELPKSRTAKGTVKIATFGAINNQKNQSKKNKQE